MLKHGESYPKSKEYIAWTNMKKRCYDKKYSSYKNYGARGIRVHSDWLNDYSKFLKDMGRCPDGMSLDRINNGRGYGPKNCRWATKFEQCNNMRSNRLITHNGKTQTMAQWAREIGLNYKNLDSRLRAGHVGENLFSVNKLPIKLSEFDKELVVRWYKTMDFTQTEVARAFDVTQARVSKILTESGIRSFSRG